MDENVWAAPGDRSDYSDGPGTPYIESGARPRPRGVALLAGIVAALLVVGTMGAIVQAGRSKTTKTPLALINAAPSATTHGGSAHYTSTIAISLSGQAGASVKMSGETDFLNKDSQITVTSDGLSSTIRLLSGVEYYQSSVIPLPAGAQWVKILPQDLGVTGTQPGFSGSGDPSQGLQFLGSTVGTPVDLGHETLNGASVTHYSVIYDLASLFARVSQAGSTISPSFANGFKALAGKVDLARIPGHVWLDSAGRVRQFDFTIAFQTDGLAFSELETTTFSEFGTPVHITAPPASATVPFSAVRNEFAQLFSPTGPTD